MGGAVRLTRPGGSCAARTPSSPTGSGAGGAYRRGALAVAGRFYFVLTIVRWAAYDVVICVTGWLLLARVC